MAYLAVCGHTNVDVLLEMEQLPKPGESRPVLSRRTVYGGTAANIARHAAGLGVPVRLWSRVGPDFPQPWRTELVAAGVTLAHLDVDPELPTPTCFVLTTPSGEQSYCMDQGAMGIMAEHPPTAALLEGVDGWLHIGTGDPATWRHLLPAARAQGLPIAFDPGQEIHFSYSPESFSEMLAGSDVFWANATEATQACKLLDVPRFEDVLEHVQQAVVTRGARGLALYRRDQDVLEIPTVPVDAVDPTGAGDALRAGFYAGLHEGMAQEDALAFGQHAAAACVQMQGPQAETITRRHLPAVAQ